MERMKSDLTGDEIDVTCTPFIVNGLKEQKYMHGPLNEFSID